MRTWRFETSEPDERTSRHRLMLDGAPASFEAALSGLMDNRDLREALLVALRGSRFDAFFWETPPVASSSLSRAFEFVLVDARSLGRGPADDHAFREHLDGAAPGTSAVAFPSLRGDALLIAPTRISDAANYNHLAAFVRTAPAEQQHELLRLVAQSARACAASRRTWMSTSGLGVAWLHVRLDSVPKYYSFGEFRED